jgi:hypothetical protein
VVTAGYFFFDFALFLRVLAEVDLAADFFADWVRVFFLPKALAQLSE